MFGFFLFDWESTAWAARIASKIEYLTLAIQNGAAYRLNSFDYDLVLLTARHESEFLPIKGTLFGRQRGTGHPLWRDRSFFGQLPIGGGRRLRTALLCIGGTGLAPAASFATQAIQVLRPALVVMLGMCAGFRTKGVDLMDVLVARDSACWQEGKSLDGDSGETFDLRARNKNSSAELGGYVDRQLEMNYQELSKLIEAFSRKREYLDLHAHFKGQMPAIPKVKAGLIVSGSEVVASAQTMNEVMRRHPNALGLEMEIYAVYTAAALALGKHCEFLAIKAVADFADQEKKDATQKLASELSAQLLVFLLKKYFG
jgi:nucleoside phosphorylase